MNGFTRRASLLDAFWDAIVRGEPRPDATGIPPDQADTVRWFQQLSTPVPDPNRDRAWSALEQRIRTEHAFEETNAMTGAFALAPTARPAPPPALPSRRPLAPSLRSRTMTWVSATLLIALLGALAYGIFAYQDRTEPTLPAVIGTPSPEASPLGSDWPQFRGGVERTGYSSDPGPGANLNLLWTFTSEESLNGIMEAGGNIIGFGAGGGLYAIDALTGQQVWAIDLSAGTAGDPGTAKLPAIDNGTIFVSTLEGDLVAVDAADGTVLWQQHLAEDTPNSPTVADGTVYVVANGNRFLGFDAETGEQTWEAAIPGVVDNQFPTIAGGKIFIADDSSKVHAFDLESGEILWSSDDIAAHRVSAYMDGVLYVPGYDGRLTAISADDGHVLWATQPSNGEALNPIAAPSVIVDIVAGTGVQGLDPKTGDVLWTSDLIVSGTHSPHAAGDYVYVHRDDDNYVALRLSDGSIAATNDQAAGAGSTAAISGNLLFVSGLEGKVRAFGPGTGETIDTVATPAVAPVDLSGPAASANEQSPIEAPTGGGIEAVLVTTMSDQPAMVLLADDGNGHLWTTDGRDGSLKMYDRDLNLLETWPFGLGSGPGQFDWTGVHITAFPDFNWTGGNMVWGPNGTAYVTDLNNARVQMIDPTGKSIGSWGTPGKNDGQFQAPVSIALQGDEIAVVDFGRRDIQWFDLQGNFLRKLTGPQPGSQFMRPTDIVYDTVGNFWVLDTYQNQLLKFDANNNLLFTIGSPPPSSSPGRFVNPSDIAIDTQDRVWVADQWNRRIEVFDTDGNLLADWDGCNTNAACFQETALVFADSNGNVFVADYDGEGMNPPRMMKFKITSMPEVPMMAAATPAAAGLATPVASPVAG
jgi:outer membrane protein assembly factor BamB